MATLNSEFKIAYAELNDRNAYVDSRTRSLRYVQRKVTGQAFDFTVRSTKIEDKNIKKVTASISAINRDNADLQLYLPIWSDSNASTTTTSEAASRGAISITMLSSSNVEVGDFFTFSGHKKAYQVTDIAGTLITFSPNLVFDVASGETVTFDGMTFNFKISGRPQTYPLSSNDQSIEIELDLIEKW